MEETWGARRPAELARDCTYQLKKKISMERTDDDIGAERNTHYFAHSCCSQWDGEDPARLVSGSSSTYEPGSFYIWVDMTEDEADISVLLRVECDFLSCSRLRATRSHCSDPPFTKTRGQHHLVSEEVGHDMLHHDRVDRCLDSRWHYRLGFANKFTFR